MILRFDNIVAEYAKSYFVADNSAIFRIYEKEVYTLWQFLREKHLRQEEIREGQTGNSPFPAW